MRKSQLTNLVAGSKVLNKKDNSILEVVGLEGGKYILSNGKCYSESTMYRWFDLYVEEVEQPKEAVEDKTVQPIKPTNTSEKTVEDEIPGETHTNSNNHVVEGKNSIEELFNQFNKVLDEHNAYFKQYKQYIGVLSPRKKGTLLQVRPNREGSINIDIKKCIWKKLKAAYQVELQRKYNAYIYDKTRGYIRFNNMDDVSTFTVLLITALS